MLLSRPGVAFNVEPEELVRVLRGLDQLTRRECQVLQGMLDGETNKGIALTLGISHRTVEVHRFRIVDKLKISPSGRLLAVVSVVLTNHPPHPDATSPRHALFRSG